MTTAWLVLVLGNSREHAGNDGYDDSPSQHYSWDNTVQNHARVAMGDVIVLWDRKELIGVSVIEAIDTATAEKTLYSCPQCGKADIKQRQRERPAYRCGKCGHLFSVPRQRTRTVTTYRSVHGKRWMNGRGLLSGSELRALCDAPKSQLSMRPARWERLRQALLDVTGQAGTVKDIAAATRLAIAGGTGSRWCEYALAKRRSANSCCESRARYAPSQAPHRLPSWKRLTSTATPPAVSTTTTADCCCAVISTGSSTSAISQWTLPPERSMSPQAFTAIRATSSCMASL